MSAPGSRQGFCLSGTVTGTDHVWPDVVTVAELALASAVPVREVEALLARESVPLIDERFMAWSDAVELGRILRAERSESAGPAIRTQLRPARAAATVLPVLAPPTAPHAPGEPRQSATTLFEAHASTHRSAALPAAVSGAVHGAAILTAALLTTAGLGSAVAARVDPSNHEPLRLVFLSIPGPGGGGGGGGARRALAPPKALRKGASHQSSPVPQVELPRPIEPAPKPVDPPKPPPPREEPAVVAPVASSPADEHARPGILEETSVETDSRGPGAGGGVGTGSGDGIGEGQGPGIGPGSGGGTGGGPYRPGSGIEPPRLLREIRADYTEEARRAGIQGEVLLEIVVRRDGTVGDVRVLRGLGDGLERRAIDAVRQWRFSPARRLGSPVDVIVEVSVEFRLR